MEKSSGCARPTGALVGEMPETQEQIEEEGSKMEIKKAKVGQKAPGFTAPAFYQGGFTEVNLSDYIGDWLLLCFYPGDFTFV